MRFSLVWSAAFVANAAMASVCKPRVRDTSIASAEFRTTMISTETHTVDTTASTTVEVSTSTTTSAVDDSTTVATSEVDTVTSGIPSSSTTATTDATEISTTADATTAQSTTTSDATTTVPAPEPFPTFDVLAIGGSINGQYIKGVANEGSMMGWDLTGTGIGHMPPFTIEPGTNFAKVLRNDLYLCIGYGDGSEPNYVATCDLITNGNIDTGFLTCEQTTDRKLKCSVPGVQCVFEPDTVCTPTGGEFDQFYTYSGRSDGLWLAIDSSSNPPTDSTYQPIELGITLNESK
ncbi:hypothetical protein LB503_009640 [Fusarium chuoi]|nr:hypothetical protein LB503_009640 [Fusarium chuoi]